MNAFFINHSPGYIVWTPEVKYFTLMMYKGEDPTEEELLLPPPPPPQEVRTKNKVIKTKDINPFINFSLINIDNTTKSSIF